jgi:hypothetical protein
LRSLLLPKTRAPQSGKKVTFRFLKPFDSPLAKFGEVVGCLRAFFNLLQSLVFQTLKDLFCPVILAQFLKRQPFILLRLRVIAFRRLGSQPERGFCLLLLSEALIGDANPILDSREMPVVA